ncbi:hypothetical protein C8R47DRAFT_1136920 [Mycena vitilis]|nr:hypothetical protein C8R47DRAFT_1136920 [Mycena vitilis]
MQLRACTLAFLCALGISAATPATRTLRTAIALNPYTQSNGMSVAHPAPAPRTNAERLRRGLPLLPARRRPADAARPRRSSVPPVTVHGRVLVADLGGNPLGALTPQLNTWGALGYLTTNSREMLCAQLTYDPDMLSAGVDMSVTASVSTPGSNTAQFVGGVVSTGATSPNLGSGSYNWNPLGFVSQTPSSSPPISGSSTLSSSTGTGVIESAIWTFDPVTRAVVPQWVNQDSSKPPTALFYAASQPMFALTGDFKTFQQARDSGAKLVTFTLDVNCDVDPK